MESEESRARGQHVLAPEVRQKLIRCLEELPVLPTVVAQLMALDTRADSYFESVHDLIASEPNYSARIIATANSALSAGRSPTTTLRAALARIGSKAASNVVLAISVVKVFIPRDDWEKSLWRHALQVATAARALAQAATDAEIDADEVYSAGLLHDIGRFIMFQVAPDRLRMIDEAKWDSPEALVEMERTICGLTHTELGAMACRRWHIPDLIANVVREHHSPLPSQPVARAQKVTALIRVADIAMFPSAMPGTPGLGAADDETIHRLISPKIPPFVRLSTGAICNLVRSAEIEAELVCKAIGIG